MNSNDTNLNKEPQIEEKLKALAGDYSYLDFLIEKKFFKRYTSILKTTIWIFGLLLALISYFGISTFIDLKSMLVDAEKANDKIQAVYYDYEIRDSLATIKAENSKYYVYYS